MENDVMNVPRHDGKKSIVRKVLPVVWLALCTVLFIYAFVGMVKHICSYVELYDSTHTFEELTYGIASDVDEQLINRIVGQVAHIVLWVTAAVLLVPKIISAFRPSKPVRMTDGVTAKRKILLAVWIVLCIAVFTFLLVWSIERIQTYSEMISNSVLPAVNSTIVQHIIQLIFSIVLYLPLAVLFIPKVKAAFLPHKKKEDNV